MNSFNLSHKSSITNEFRVDYPEGDVDRVEANKKQLNYIVSRSDSKYIMFNIDEAEKLLSLGIDASDFSYKKVITTSTINDDLLPLYHLEIETELIRAFRPDFHIPCDKPVYQTQNKNERLWNIKQIVEDTIEMNKKLSDTDINLIPLIKGIDDDEISFCCYGYKSFGFEAFSYYCAQYFGNGRGNLTNQLISDVRHIVRTFDLQYLMVIGIGSRKIIQQLPRTVVKSYAHARKIRENCWKSDLSMSTQKRIIDFGTDRLHSREVLELS